MAKVNSFRTFLIGEEEYVFSVDSFRKMFSEAKMKRICNTGRKYTSESLRCDIAVAIHSGEETIKKWYKGDNGPVDLETIKALADFFEVDYMDLLRNKGEKKMSKDAICLKNTEKEVVISVYQKIVDIIWFEAYRFKPEMYTSDYQDEEEFNKRNAELQNEAYEIIDKNSLFLSDETRRKLYNILAEMKHSTGGMECAPGRWLSLNPLYFEAREYSIYGGFAEKEDETIFKLHRDIEGSVEKTYCLETDNCIYEGFHKGTTVEEVLERVGEDGKSLLDGKNFELKPTEDENNGYSYSPEEVYKYEFMKTVIQIFREDFPQYFNNLRRTKICLF